MFSEEFPTTPDVAIVVGDMTTSVLSISLLSALDSDPFDGSAWREALRELEVAPPAAAAPHYARALALFPTAGTVVLASARARLRAGDIAGADTLLQTHLLRAPAPSLWAFYCSFVEATKVAPAVASGDARASAEARAAALAAYSFATGAVGSQWGSDALWRSYANFCAALPSGSESAFAAAQAREARRKALVAGAIAPTPVAAALWQEYCAWERANSPEKLAESLISASESAHATALTVARQRAVLWRAVDADALPVPPPSDADCAAHGPKGLKARTARAAHDATSTAWRRVLGYELSNPLHAAPDVHADMVRGAFRAALAGALRFCPDAWADFAAFEGGGGGDGTGAVIGSPSDLVTRAALTALPVSALLSLGAADASELAGRDADADAIYATLLNALHATASFGGRIREASASSLPRVAVVYPSLAAIDSILSAASGDVGAACAAAGVEPPSPSDDTVISSYLRGGGGSAEGGVDSYVATRTLNLVTSSASDAADAAAAVPLVFILRQRFARRSGGVNDARAVFSAARRSPYVTPAVYVASARLEFFANGRSIDVARNVLEAARKKWPSDASLALSSADFLMAHDEVATARVFLETALEAFGGAGGLGAPRALWDRLIALELFAAPSGGSAAAVAAVERRRAAAHPALVGPEARLLLRGVHRWGVGSGGAPPATRCDADALRRHPCGPFATLPSVSAVVFSPLIDPACSASATLAPSALAGGPTALAEALALALPPRAGGLQNADGPFLQSPPHVSITSLPASLISHIPSGAMAAAAAAAVSLASASLKGGVPPPLLPPPPPPQPSLPATMAGLVPGAINAPPAPTQLAPAPATPVEPPMWLRSLLNRLPAYDASAGPLIDVDNLLRALVDGGGGGGGGGSGVAPKRRRD